MLGDAHDAEDAVHDALIRAWQRFPDLRERDRFDAWLDRIVVNVCRDRMRRSRRITFLDLDGHAELAAATDAFAAFLQRDQLTRALTGLEADLRVVVVLRYWADLSVDDIATRLGVPAGTVKSRLHRAIAALRASMPASEVTP